MKYMTSKEIRETWLKFYKNKEHKIVPSASLIPKNDPTLLWINAGVAPLKKYFDGSAKPDNTKMVNVQKCIRTNDIENVGKTARHHTFFEMLGNFSIGDYFKDTAIEYGYEILTSDEYFGFPINKLYFTYYPTDIKTKNKWISLGVSPENVIPCEHNYWEIGEGPSGPNTEIFFDRGSKYGLEDTNLIKNDIENDRYIEIWNIVFSQYNAKANLKRSEYKELPSKNIDTGGGLERFACVLQDVETNFETDLFMPIIKEVSKLSNVEYNGQMSFKVIADHIKTLVFAISDGAMLSNEGRGYVLRRVLRRAVKHGRNLGFKKPFLHKLITVVIDTMDDFYPELDSNKDIISKIIIKEEKQFLETIEDGEKLLLSMIDENTKTISGTTAFKLYDTYGFPIELTLEYAKDNDVVVDIKGFNESLEEQKARSRNARTNTGSMKVQDDKFIKFTLESKFVGYNQYEVETEVIAVFDEGIVLKETPFYANSGGQVSDLGAINNIKVKDVKKLPNNQHLHIIDTETFSIGNTVIAKIDISNRKAITKNHTATHILHQALKDVLGKHVNQQGSQVNSESLRFDFNHYENLTDNQILKIEKIVKDKINEAIDVNVNEMSLSSAKELGAMALFDKKYGSKVRVVNMGYSIELCGGTHVENTKEIGEFAIFSIQSIGSGIFRIEATTNNIKEKITSLCSKISEEIIALNDKASKMDENYQKQNLDNSTGSYQDIINAKLKLDEIRNNVHVIEKKVAALKVDDVLNNANQYIPKNPSKKLVVKTTNIAGKTLKQLGDIIFDKVGAETLLLVNIDSNKATYIAKTDGGTHAGKLVKTFSSFVKGSGGGRDTMAQGGTKNISLVDEAISQIEKVL